MLKAKLPFTFSVVDQHAIRLIRAQGTPGNPGTLTHEDQGTHVGRLSSSASQHQGYINTDYTYLMSKGRLIPMTPWEAYKGFARATSGQLDVKQFSTSPYYRYWTRDEPAQFWTWYYSEGPCPWDSSITTFRSIALTKDYDYYVQAAAAKIYSSGWDSLTFAAELSKTVAMFRQLVGRVTALALSGKLESLWLEGRYGWRTLAYDMKDIDKAIVNLNEGRKRFLERVGTTETVSSTRSDAFTQAWGTLTVSTVHSDSIGIRGSVAADIEPPRFQFNPLTTAWELITLSFVVDWFLNVGQFLESLSFLALSREYTAAGGISINRSSTSTSSWVPAAGFTGTWNISHTASHLYVTRKPTSVSTIPLPHLRLNAFKVLDLVALFLQSLGKKNPLAKLIQNGVVKPVQDTFKRSPSKPRRKKR